MAEDIQKLVGQVRAKAWVDKGFRKALVEDPKQAIEELFSVKLPEMLSINIVEENPGTLTIVLPAQLNEAELTDDQLDSVAGGWGCICDCFNVDCFDVGCKG